MKLSAYEDIYTPIENITVSINAIFFQPNFLHNGKDILIPIILHIPTNNCTNGIIVIFIV